MGQMENFNNTVQIVVDRLLCTSCGTCAGACPSSSINMAKGPYGTYIPEINQNSCSNCGICLKTCPGIDFRYSAHYEAIHGKLPDHVALGGYINCYAGHTSDPEILKKSQSGGIVSTLLIHCLEKGIIDGAIVTSWRKGSPLEPITCLAQNRSEVLNASGSIYNPVPASEIIAEIRKTDGHFAFVGTPCQIQGFRKAEQIFPALKEKISLYVGLHCLGVFTYHFHDQILQKIKLKKSDVAEFRHRDKTWRGWPCDMRIVDKNNKVYNIDDRNSRFWPRPFFTNWRCQLCFDKSNEFSDISCGDCRISSVREIVQKDNHDLKNGLSEFVVRTKRGNIIIDQLISEKKIIAYECGPDPVAASIGVAGKKLGVNTFFKIARLFGLGVPEYGVSFSLDELDRSITWKILKPWAIVASIRYYLFFILSRHVFFRTILARVPHKAFAVLDSIFRKKVEWVVFSSSPHLTRTITSYKEPASINNP